MDIHTSIDNKIYLKIYNPKKNKVESVYTGLSADQQLTLERLEELKKMAESIVNNNLEDKENN